mmetsp:Transcript_74322/g.91295  ORF Transcript_74322/g.91295 Transcript_74322/m.91295 type:complete len:204 (+) Transcript_74322:79-690(+)
MVNTAFFAPLIGAWKGAAVVKTAMVTAAAGSHMLPHAVGVDHSQVHSHDHLEHDSADHGDHGHDEHHEDHEEHHEDHEEHDDHEEHEEGDEMEETVEAAEFAHENGASGGPQFWRSFQKRSQSHSKATPESASATNAEAVLKAVAAAAAVASVTSRMVESRCQELKSKPKIRSETRGMERGRKPWRSCGDPFPNPSGQLSMVV